jgi:hypothetical protein
VERFRLRFHFERNSGHLRGRTSRKLRPNQSEPHVLPEAHNPKVAGSNPAPATQGKPRISRGFPLGHHLGLGENPRNPKVAGVDRARKVPFEIPISRRAPRFARSSPRPPAETRCKTPMSCARHSIAGRPRGVPFEVPFVDRGEPEIGLPEVTSCEWPQGPLSSEQMASLLLRVHSSGNTLTAAARALGQ